MSEQQEHKTFSLWTVLTVAGSVFITAATGGWIVGRTLMEDVLNQYEKSRNWDLPGNIEALGKLSKTLTITAEEKEKLITLKEIIDTKEKEINDLKNKNKTLEKELAELKRLIQPLQGDSFELKDGETLFLVPGKLALTIKSTSPTHKSLSVQFGQDSKYLSQAEPMSALMNNKKYTIIPIKVTYEGASFALSIEDSH